MKREPVFHSLYRRSTILGMPPAMFYTIVGGCVGYLVITKNFLVALPVAVVLLLSASMLYHTNPEWPNSLKFLLRMPYCPKYKTARLPSEEDHITDKKVLIKKK